MARPACGIYEALWLARLHKASAQALYLHVPFCVRKCRYCDFSSWATPAGDPLMGDYMQALVRLLWQAKEAGVLAGCQTAYVGGGTPTLLGSGLSELVAEVRACCPDLRELSCEANSDSLTDDLLAQLASAGCTRLSVGVQSLCDEELAVLGRIHTAAQAMDRLRAAVASGLDVSCDLMCAIPGQTDESWRLTLDQAIACGVGHVSVYPLQIEEGTPFDEQYGGREQPWNAPEVQADRMEVAADALSGAGFARYEVASYAWRDKRCAHNVAYWTALPYMGLGTGASSMLTREAYERLRCCASQLPQASDGIQRVRLTCTDDSRSFAKAESLADLHVDLEFLSGPQAAAEDLMLGMRLTDGVGPGLMAHARAELGPALDEALAEVLDRGLATWRGQALVPTERGWLLGNELYGRLWELAPGEVELVQA